MFRLSASAPVALMAFMAGAMASDVSVFVEMPTLASTTASTETSTTDQVSSTEPPPSSTPTEPTTTTESSTPSPTVPRPPATHTINVGANGHKYSPESLEANVGDVLEFRFYPGDHWAIRGDFNDPCIPYEYVETGQKGFSSGEQHVDDINNPPRWRVTVNDTKPIFYYCAASGSCVPNHMMGVVNPTANETMAEWRLKADNADFQLRPGEPWPSETGESSSSDSHKGPSLNGGEIAGIVVGSIAVLAVAALLFFWCGRRGGFKAAYHKHIRGSSYQDHQAGAPPMMHAPSAGTQNEYSPCEYGQVYHSPVGQMAAYSQSPPPVSPEHSVPYAYSPDHMAAGHYGHQIQPHPYVQVPMPEIRNSPVELPTSHDPGNSPLPDYQDNEDRPRFSWMVPTESACQPPKT